MSLKHVLAATVVACVVGAASAAIIPIGEFTGEAFEGFEGISTPGGLTSPVDIFNGQATIDDTLAHTIMIAYSLYSALTDEYIYPYNGNLMGGSVTGWCAFDFPTPVTDFGGYIGTTDVLTGSTVTFRDAGGAIIESSPITIEHPLWAWHGWHSDTPIARIEILADVAPGKPLVFDDMTANFVPEPATLGLLAIGATALLRRRR